MRIGVLGINHKSASFDLLERFTRASLKYFNSSVWASSLGYVLLSTCNRAEIYFSATDLAGAHTYLLSILREEIRCEFEHHVYAYFGSDCFGHLARVTSGLDSALIGETEIQGQVKRAYEQAMAKRQLPNTLHFLFQKSLMLGKKTRQSLGLLRTSSLEKTVFQLIEKRGKTLLIGVSEINCKLLNCFKETNRAADVTLCNRTAGKANELHTLVLPWELLNASLQCFDVLVFATQAPQFLLHAHSPLGSSKLIIDLSVPRNVDPLLGNTHLLYNIDQLNKLAARPLQVPQDGIAYEVNKLIALFHKRELFLASIAS
jgi:glutamyl-tRNA reductase